MSKLGDRFKQRKELEPDPEEYYQQDYPMQEAQIMRQYPEKDDEEEDNSPLSIVKEIKENPSQKGTFPTVIGGTPVDLHILEDYLVRTSPYALKTVMRYHNARNMEEIKNYSRGPNLKVNSKMWIMIILLIGVVCLGVFMIMFMPKIMAMFQGGM